MNRRFLLVVALVAALVGWSTGAALAADVDEVAQAVAEEGFFVERGTSADSGDISRIVSDVRNEGEKLSIVVLADEPGGGATTFGDAVVDELIAESASDPGLVVVIAPETVGFAGTSEVYTPAEINTALDRAIDRGGDDGDIAQTFASELIGVPVGSGAPATTSSPATTSAQSPASSSDGGGGGGFLLFLLLVGGGLLLFFWLRGRKKKQAAKQEGATAQLGEARQAVQAQLNAIANDILDMEDEVRLADNPRADRFYQEASQTYRAATEAFPKAQTAQHLLDLANQLDIAIWQLDSAEAVLDGNPLPERPEPRRLEPQTREPVGAPGRAGTTVSRPEYQRRPSRRSSYGGPSMMDLLIMVGGAMMSGRRRGGGLFGRSSRSTSQRSGGGLGGLFGRSSRRSSPERQSGSTPIPSPSQKGTPTSRPSSRPSSSKRGSGGKRIRGGRRRRR